MAGRNHVEVLGGVVKAEMKAVGNRGAIVQSFTVKVTEAEWNRETRAEEVTATFIPCERFMPDDYTDQDVVYVGDGVFALGRFTQQRGNDGRDHTRIQVHVVTVTKRGNQFKQRTPGTPGPGTSQGPAYDAPRQQQPAPPAVAHDPWAQS